MSANTQLMKSFRKLLVTKLCWLAVVLRYSVCSGIDCTNDAVSEQKDAVRDDLQLCIAISSPDSGYWL